MLWGGILSNLNVTWQKPGMLSLYNPYNICLICWESDSPGFFGSFISIDMRSWSPCYDSLHIPSNHNCHIWPYLMWTWLLSKPSISALWPLQKVLHGNKLVLRGPPSVLCLFQANSHFPSGLGPAVLLGCLSLCFCEDIIHTQYGVGSLI